MTELDWYEKTEALLHKGGVGEWNRLVSEAVDIHLRRKLNTARGEHEIKEILHGLLRKLQGFPPTWLVIAGQEGSVQTPDEMFIHPAWNAIEVQGFWDLHDGRKHGTMVVGVYLWRFEDHTWARDLNWGIMGDPSRTGTADPENPGDRLC